MNTNRPAEPAAMPSLRSGAWAVVRAAYATGRTDLWKHGRGFVTEAVRAGVVVREGTEAVLTARGRAAATRICGDKLDRG